MKKLLLFAACMFGPLPALAASVPNIPLDKSNGGPPKSIALMGVPEPSRFQVRDFYRVANLAGPLGGFAAGSVDADRTKKFLEEAVIANKVKFGERLAADLQHDLEEAGFTVEFLGDQIKKVKKAADGKTDDFSAVSTDKDAILAVWFGPIGFLSSAKLSTKFQSSVDVNAKLIDRATQKVLYQKTYVYGYDLGLDKAELLVVDEKYQFGDFDDLMKRKDLAIEALDSGLKVTASRITADLR